MADRVAVLLATFEGARFLPEQLASLAAQTHTDWVLYWRDDGSQDGTPALVENAAGPRLRPCPGPAMRLGPAANFLFLLREAVRDPENAFFAFCDQDDVWQEEKLARALARLRREGLEAEDGTPLLYCAGAELVDAHLRPLGLLRPPPLPPAFPASLTENIATGCTIVLDRHAAERIAASTPPPEVMHDWWSYSLVSAAGGRIIIDPEPVLRYRQHGTNAIGARRSAMARALRALARGAGPFMAIFRAHVRGLRQNAALLSPAAQGEVTAIAEALESGARGRFRLLFRRGLRRHRPLETLLFRLWLLIG